MDGWGYVYVVQMEDYPWLKIGSSLSYAPGGAQGRLSSLQVGCPLLLRLVREYYSSHCRMAERIIHKMLVPHHFRGEWFATTLAVIDAAYGVAVAKIANHVEYLSEREKAKLELTLKGVELGDALMAHESEEVRQRLTDEYEHMRANLSSS